MSLYSIQNKERTSRYGSKNVGGNFWDLKATDDCRIFYETYEKSWGWGRGQRGCRWRRRVPMVWSLMQSVQLFFIYRLVPVYLPSLFLPVHYYFDASSKVKRQIIRILPWCIFGTRCVYSCLKSEKVIILHLTNGSVCIPYVCNQSQT